MGNNGSVTITDKSNGIFDVDVEGYPNYPIAYLRLCYNPEDNSYCVAETCNVHKKPFANRKLLVVGMRLPEIEGIHEQAFYKSSGLNSMASFEEFFQIKIDTSKTDVWIPTIGLGYDLDSIKSVEQFEEGWKILKTYFGCQTKRDDCLYGRFGAQNPNLMQVSYCLGSGFWENNVDDINKLGYSVEKLPTLASYIDSIPCYYQYVGKSNIDCNIYLNNYIASALIMNYGHDFTIAKKKLTERIYKPNKDFSYNDVKMDWRIENILFNKGFINYRGLPLPREGGRGAPHNVWMNYFQAVNGLYIKDKKYFIEHVLPLIKQEIPIQKHKKGSIKTSVKKETKETKKDIEKGSEDNPHDKRADANIGEYYRQGKKVMKRNK